ncbi:MAG: MFS transporter [Planctomycetes bacterium]|nr:MFS transporter [Planctomycetota bacterium]
MDPTRLPPSVTRAAIRLSTIEGALASAHLALTSGALLVGFALFLGAGPFEIGLVAAIPLLAQAVSLAAAQRLQTIGRKRPLVVALAALSRGLWLPMALVPFVLPAGWALAVTLALFLMTQALLSYGNVAWNAWMADLVPERIRGRYFGRRNLVLTAVFVPVAISGGVFLDLFADPSGTEAVARGASWLDLLGLAPGRWPAEMRPWAFVGLFGAAAAAALVGAGLLSRQAEPLSSSVSSSVSPSSVSASSSSASSASSSSVSSVNPKPETLDPKPPPFTSLARLPFRDRSFRRLLGFTAFFWFVNGFGAPLWTPFMLHDLRMNFATIGFFTAIANVAGIVALMYWGGIMDRFGNRPALILCVAATSLHPLCYVVATPDFILPLYWDAISSGIAWKGVELAAFNMMLGASVSRGREMYFAMFVTVQGICQAAGSVLAGAVLELIPSVTAGGHLFTNAQVVFVGLTLTRLASLLLLRRVREEGSTGVRGMLRATMVHLRERMFTGAAK